MKFTLFLKEEAVQDLTEAFDWYEYKQSGLGAEFLTEVDAFFERILENPTRYQYYRSQRIAIMNRFPFKIVYEVEQESIFVYAIYHDKRSPEKLAKRR